MRVLSLGLLSSALLMLVFAGCGGRDAALPDLVPVTGTVTLDGQPAADVMVTFSPTDTTVGGFCHGITDASGHYELVDPQGAKGAQVGEFRVTCSKWVMPDGSLFTSAEESPMMAGAEQSIAANYSDEAETELKATVAAGGGTFDFELTSGTSQTGP